MKLHELLKTEDHDKLRILRRDVSPGTRPLFRLAPPTRSQGRPDPVALLAEDLPPARKMLTFNVLNDGVPMVWNVEVGSSQHLLVIRSEFQAEMNKLGFIRDGLDAVARGIEEARARLAA